MPFGTLTLVDPIKHVLDGGVHWRNLATTIEPSTCGGDAALLNYFDHLFQVQLSSRLQLPFFRRMHLFEVRPID